MIKQQIIETILKAIGEDKVPMNGVTTGDIEVDVAYGTYNLSLADLRLKAPQLAEEIVGLMETHMIPRAEYQKGYVIVQFGNKKYQVFPDGTTKELHNE
jgi:hypothetical protein